VLGAGAPERLRGSSTLATKPAWILEMAEAGRSGMFNVAGP